MSQIKCGCKHGSFFDPPFEKDGCPDCASEARKRFIATKKQHYRFVKANHESEASNYYFDVLANEDEEMVETKNGKARIKTGDRVDIEYWDEEDVHYFDRKCKLYDEGNISHILANCFAEYTNDKDEIDLEKDENHNPNELEEQVIEDIIMRRIAPYANELWSIIYHFRNSMSELVSFIRKDVLKKKSDPTSIASESTVNMLKEQYNDMYGMDNYDKSNYGLLGYGVASDYEMPEDIGQLTKEDMMMCYMMYGGEGLDMMKQLNDLQPPSQSKTFKDEDDYDY